MTEKISSRFTEPIKFIWTLYLLQLAVRYFLYYFGIFDTGIGSIDFFLIIVFAAFTFDYWKLKEVEMTETGLIITSKYGFRQKCAFIPYNKIESTKTKFWWLGDIKRIYVKFKEETEFGKEIVFINKGYWRYSQREILDRLDRKIIENQQQELKTSTPPLSITSES